MVLKFSVSGLRSGQFQVVFLPWKLLHFEQENRP